MSELAKKIAKYDRNIDNPMVYGKMSRLVDAKNNSPFHTIWAPLAHPIDGIDS
jgi:hypothetical protein